MQITSKVTGLCYSGEDMVYISNPLQTAKYMKHGATLYDVIQSQDKLIFIFSRSETRMLFDLWCRRELP